MPSELPFSLRYSEVEASAKYALWWARSIPDVLLKRCYWFADDPERPPVGGTVYLWAARWRNMGFLFPMDVVDGGAILERPLRCFKSNHLIAKTWRALQSRGAEILKTSVMTCRLTWVSSCRVVWNGMPEEASPIPRAAWKPPPRKGGPGHGHKRHGGRGADRDGRSAPKRRRRSASAAHGAAGPVGADHCGHADPHPGPSSPAAAECDDDAASISSDDAAAAELLDVEYCADGADGFEIDDSVLEALGHELCPSTPEHGAAESPADDDDNHSDASDIADSSDGEAPVAASPNELVADPDSLPIGIDAAAVSGLAMPADVEELCSSQMHASAMTLQRRHDAFLDFNARAARTPAMQRKYARDKYGCTSPVFHAEHDARPLALLEDERGVVSVWHFVLTDLHKWPCPCLMDMHTGTMSVGFGFPMRIDALDRFICPGGISDTKRSVMKFTIVSPDIGMVLQKGPKSERQERPSHVQRLGRIWNHSSAPLVLSPSCCLCGIGGADERFTCSMCLCTFHRPCIARCKPSIDRTGAYRPELLPMQLNKANMCMFCRDAFGI